MKKISYTTLKNKLLEIMQETEKTNSPILISKKNDCEVVIISKREYEKLLSK